MKSSAMNSTIIEDSGHFLELGWSIRKCYTAIKRAYDSSAPDYHTFYKWLVDKGLISGHPEYSSLDDDKIPDIHPQKAPRRMDARTKLGRVLEDITFEAVKKLSEEKHKEIVYIENAKKPGSGTDIWFLTANPFRIFNIECKNWDVPEWYGDEKSKRSRFTYLLETQVGPRFRIDDKSFNRNERMQKLSNERNTISLLIYTGEKIPLSWSKAKPSGVPISSISLSDKAIQKQTQDQIDNLAEKIDQLLHTFKKEGLIIAYI